MLQQESNYEFRKRMLEVHESDIRDLALVPDASEFVISDEFSIYIPNDADDVIVTAARDFIDYLFTSMGIAAMLKKGEGSNRGNELVILPEGALDLGEYSGYRGYRVDVEDDRILVCGFDSRGVAQALYYLEDVMNFRRAPYLIKQSVIKRPMYGPQMVHSGYGLDEYPNEYLSAVAHEGRDAILVFVKDVNITPYGFLDFNELIHRAKKYGIDVYAYSYLKSEKHPDDPEAEAHYEASYGRLFKECPGLKGVTLVGESVEFPSEDPHVTGHHHYDNTIDGIPTGKTSPGWYPCCDYPKWLELIKRVIRKYNKDADIVFWTYNWGWRSEEERLKLIEKLPTDISLQATFEMCEIVEIGGVKNFCADYTLSNAGPGSYFKSEAIAAKKRGIKLYSMTNTGGLTWDFGVIPYEPFPYQWIKRYKEMEYAHKEWGLCGLMESHHYGFTPSFISKLSKWVFCEPHDEYEVILKRILSYEFGEDNADSVDEALKYWSEAITHYTPTDGDQYGAFRIGPSYPLCLVNPIKPPSAPYSMFGNRIVDAMYVERSIGHSASLSVRIVKEQDSLNKVKENMEKGLLILKNIENKNEKLQRLINLGEFILCSTITGIHSKEWYRLKMQLRSEENTTKLKEVLDSMESLLLEEKQNVEAAIPLVQVDSKLGWEPSMEYMTDEKHLRWKLRHIEYVLNTEIQTERNCLALS